MTLISNEIHLQPNLDDVFIICCADTRLTFRGETNKKKKYLKGHKLFKIEYLNGTVSFWGATSLFENNVQKYLSNWLPNFITKRNHHTTLKSFVDDLRSELNRKMYKPFLEKEASGFHFACINPNGVPEFIHFSNCGLDASTGNYGNIINEFREPQEDFLKRDVFEFNWNGDPKTYTAVPGISLYRNGSIKAHSAAWSKLDEAYRTLFLYPDFKYPDGNVNADIIKFTRQKLLFISSLYNSWAQTKIVGAPWDIIILRKKNYSVHSRPNTST